jgi:hypothetical protein
MASVEVFVDDAVRGNLPRVCAKSGVPADGFLRFEQAQGGVGAGWLLVFLGPIGWIALVLWLALSRRSVLTVRLPYASDAIDRESHLRHLRTIWALVGLATLIAMLVPVARATVPPLMIGVAALVALVVAGVYQIMAWRASVGIELDASHRWVTLSGVHPAFAAAVNRRHEAYQTPA